MEKNYKFYNFDKVNCGRIYILDSDREWQEILLKNVTAITYMEDYFVCDNFKINLLKIGVLENGKYHCYHFNFSETLPVQINGFLCKNFEQLDITIRNCIPVN